jgi:hypothetical protein
MPAKLGRVGDRAKIKTALKIRAVLKQPILIYKKIQPLVFQSLSTAAFVVRLSDFASVAMEITIPAAIMTTRIITCFRRPRIFVFAISLYCISFVIT